MKRVWITLLSAALLFLASGCATTRVASRPGTDPLLASDDAGWTLRLTGDMP